MAYLNGQENNKPNSNSARVVTKDEDKNKHVSFIVEVKSSNATARFSLEEFFDMLRETKDTLKNIENNSDILGE